MIHSIEFTEDWPHDALTEDAADESEAMEVVDAC